MTRAEAALYIRQRYGLPVSKVKLDHAATNGSGPRFYLWKGGLNGGGRGRRAVYLLDDLDAWVHSQLILKEPSPFSEPG